MMKRSKSQAVYKMLPGMWVSDKSEGFTMTAQITAWVYHHMEGIYDQFIEREIKRLIEQFGENGGDNTSYNLDPDRSTLCIVEPAECTDAPDIIGYTSPLTFYCSSCGHATFLNKNTQINPSIWKCSKCGKNSVKQLQMVYVCECGYAQPITRPQGVPFGTELIYRPHESTKSSYKMFYKQNNVEKTAEFNIRCPSCGSFLKPQNATAPSNYRPHTARIINLVDKESGRLYERGLDAQKIVVAKWFGKISPEDYSYIRDNVDQAFSPDNTVNAKMAENIAMLKQMLSEGILNEESYNQAVALAAGNTKNNHSAETYVNACDEIFSKQKVTDPSAYIHFINYYSFKLMQYYSLKENKRIIPLQAAIDREMEMEFIDSEDDILSMNRKMGIADMQVSCDVEIVNCTYGYTRKLTDPKKSTNHKCRLKLSAYKKTKDGSANLVYGAKLNTEGVLIEFDQAKIIDWLYRNKVIDESQLPDLEDPLSVKKWYAEYVHGDKISFFGELDESEKITQYVFSLLHSISHGFLKTAGMLSGLASSSLMENIIVETASIFIYAQSGQGLTLGSISGMIENNYIGFLRQTYENTRTCVYDPICTERDDTACSGCLLIADVACSNFNSLLGRKYLYHIDGIQEPSVGFWEMD